MGLGPEAATLATRLLLLLLRLRLATAATPGECLERVVHAALRSRIAATADDANAAVALGVEGAYLAPLRAAERTPGAGDFAPGTDLPVALGLECLVSDCDDFAKTIKGLQRPHDLRFGLIFTYRHFYLFLVVRIDADTPQQINQLRFGKLAPHPRVHNLEGTVEGPEVSRPKGRLLEELCALADLRLQTFDRDFLAHSHIASFLPASTHTLAD